MVAMKIPRHYPHFILLVLTLFGAIAARPCTTFVLECTNGLYFGRNLDWFSEDALVIVNPRGVQKTALVAPPNAPAKWVSKYGSLTFNSAGWDLPTGGMNETGLVVENMWLEQTQAPSPDARPALNSLQWIQYQLDTCRTVVEVIASDKKVRLDLTALSVPVHYLICDASGDCATIEFLKGAMVVHRGKDLPYRALANEAYTAAAAHTSAHPEPTEPAKKLRGDPPFERFVRVVARAASFRPATPRKNLDYAFETLDQVAVTDFTVWRLVYDVKQRQIHYRTRSRPEERVLDLNQMDFACHAPVKFFSLRLQTGSGAPAFAELSEAKHRAYLESYLAQDWVKKQFGDMKMFVEFALLNLRSYRCAEAKADTGG
jgi:penicillin V acylase-like amidase (Ntn superfamily)